MKRRHTILAFSVLTIVGLAFFAHSFVSRGWGTRKSEQLKKQPTHVATPPDGKLASAHTEGEVVRAHSSGADPKVDDGSQIGRIQSRAKVDPLVSAKKENSAVRKTPQHSIQNNDLSVSPFKGPTDAPVAIEVFSDFQ